VTCEVKSHHRVGQIFESCSQRAQRGPLLELHGFDDGQISALFCIFPQYLHASSGVSASAQYESHLYYFHANGPLSQIRHSAPVYVACAVCIRQNSR
jgi:hypothetical protein